MEQDGRIGTCCAIEFETVGEESEVLSDQDISEIQDADPVICKVKDCILNKVTVRRWPRELAEYRRFIQSLVVCVDVLYYLRRERSGEVVRVPVLSYEGMVGLVIIVHWKYGHAGKNRLWMLMKDMVFHPKLSKVVGDVATTCERCQKRKFQAQSAAPPVRKIEAREPFELIVMDIVSLPRTTSGHVGMLVGVDHKSKFCYAVPLPNKTSDQVARVVRERMLPMIVETQVCSF